MNTVMPSHVNIPFGFAISSRAVLLLAVMFTFCLGTIWTASAQIDVGYIANRQSSLTKDGMTNHSGYYTSQPLQPGLYTVPAKMPDFTSAAICKCVVDVVAHEQGRAEL